MKKILFIATHRKDTAPGQRFRFEQYFDFLEQNGFQCTLSPLITSASENKLYYGSSYLKKIIAGFRMGLRRLNDVFHKQEYDIIFIAREAFMTGGVFFERSFRKSKAKLIFDFDDAIWLNVISEKNKYFAWLKSASKTRRIIELCDCIIAGNEYLAKYALSFNKNVVILPTTINTELYQPNYSNDNDRIIIGWSGSVSTVEHFLTAIPALLILKKKYGHRIDFRVIGDANFKNESLGISGMPWRRETELQDLWPIHIGIMPLPDTVWTWGKCGLKGLQYMALEIPTVMSPVGVNVKIIQNAVNGFLATTTEEWVEKISLLIEDENLRVRLGKEGRKTVELKYSVQSQKENYLTVFNELYNSRRGLHLS